MKRSTIAVAGVLALALVGGGTAFALTTAEGPAPVVEETTAPTPEATSTPTASPEPSPSTEPLTATEPAEERDESGFLTFVHGRLATFPSQIPDATDEQLIAAGDVACERIREGESVDRMSVIEGEEPSEMGGYFYDSNAIIAGAQMHLCKETLG